MRIMTVFGTRPEGIKMAPLIKELEKDGKKNGNMHCIVVNTAQHREMLDQVLEIFNIQPDYDLNVMRQNQTIEHITADIIVKLTPILKKEQPDVVLVHGDTTTTFAAAYAAYLEKIPVGHVEAGLRTFQAYSPFPEEMNRSLVGRLAFFHFAPTEKNKRNLEKENIHPNNIEVVGNTVIDALLYVTENKLFDQQKKESEIIKIAERSKRFILLTTHRRENVEQLGEVYEAINDIVEKYQDVEIIFPVHKNPRVRQEVENYLIKSERIHVTEPLEYVEFCHLMKLSYLIITDSGGIQEEAPALGKPVLVARDSTERPEGVQAGTLKLVGTNRERIFAAADALLSNEAEYKKMSCAKNPYGDGHSSKKIIDFLKKRLE